MPLDDYTKQLVIDEIVLTSVKRHRSLMRSAVLSYLMSGLFAVSTAACLVFPQSTNWGMALGSAIGCIASYILADRYVVESRSEAVTVKLLRGISPSDLEL